MKSIVLHLFVVSHILGCAVGTVPEDGGVFDSGPLSSNFPTHIVLLIDAGADSGFDAGMVSYTELVCGWPMQGDPDFNGVTDTICRCPVAQGFMDEADCRARLANQFNYERFRVLGSASCACIEDLSGGHEEEVGTYQVCMEETIQEGIRCFASTVCGSAEQDLCIATVVSTLKACLFTSFSSREASESDFCLFRTPGS